MKSAACSQSTVDRQRQPNRKNATLNLENLKFFIFQNLTFWGDVGVYQTNANWVIANVPFYDYSIAFEYLRIQ